MPRKKRAEVVDYNLESGIDLEGLMKRMEEDFFFFSSFCFPHYVTIPFSSFHEDVHNLIMNDVEKKAIILPRGHGKSTMALLEIFWHLLFKDNHYFVIIGNTTDKAKQNFILPLITEVETNSIIKMLFGDIRGTIWGMDRVEFVVRDKDGNRITKMVKPFGVGQSIRGTRYLQYRPDFVLADDIEDDEQVKSDTRREEIKSYFYDQVYPALDKQGDVYSDSVFSCTPKMIVMGTILHYDSFLINLERMNGNGWVVLKKSCVYVDEEGKRRSLWDERYSVEYWDKKYEEYKREGRERSFRQEYYNEIFIDEDREINTGNVMFYKENELEKIILRTDKYIAIDLALHSSDVLSTKMKNRYDYNVVMTIGVDRITGFVYVLDMDRFKTSDVYETIDRAFSMSEKWMPLKVFYEKTGMQKWFEALFRNKMNETGIFFNIQGVGHGSRKKEERIRATVKIMVDQKKIFLPDNNIGRIIFDEMYQFPFGKHDDAIDTLAYALSGSAVRTISKGFLEKTKENVSYMGDRIKSFLNRLDREDENDETRRGYFYHY